MKKVFVKFCKIHRKTPKTPVPEIAGLKPKSKVY